MQTLRFQPSCLAVCAFLWAGALVTGCSGDDDSTSSTEGQKTAGSGAKDQAAGGKGGSKSSTQSSGGGGKGQSATQVGQAGKSGATGTSRDAVGGAGGAGGSAADSGDKGETDRATDSPAVADGQCGANDNPESGLQGDMNSGTVNCGLTLLSELPGGGHVQGSGHCAYVRATAAAYQAGTIKAYNITDPLKPVQTDMEVGVGGSESMRAQTVEGRAILVSGRGVYDIGNCEDMVKKGEIKWPSESAMNGTYFSALSSHEIAISHDAKRVYTGLGFSVAYIEDLEHPDTWKVYDWACEMNKQSNFPTDVPNSCDGPVHQDIGRQYSHSSDDNLEGTVWYGANQNGDGFSAMESATARMVDISKRDSIKILDTLHEFPGHSMNWWRTPDKRDFIIGANEGGGGDSCMTYPRPTNLGNNLEAYVVEVTGNKFGKAFPLTLDVNRPENCMSAVASAKPGITEHSIYNKGGAAFVMLEYGTAGLRVFDLRDGEHPKEVAYYNDGLGHVHSGVFQYDEARGIMLASGSRNGHVLMLQPQVIEALGLPKPTDPKYPYK